MREPVPEGFKLFHKHSMANIYVKPETATALIATTVNFIPMESFRAIFEKAYEAIEKHQLKQVVFDKRSLTIFHQPSMEWYYTNWKVRLLRERGIITHGKVLPKDEPFRQSVHIARNKILEKRSFPELQQIRVSYFEDYQDLLKDKSFFS